MNFEKQFETFVNACRDTDQQIVVFDIRNKRLFYRAKVADFSMFLSEVASEDDDVRIAIELATECVNTLFPRNEKD